MDPGDGSWAFEEGVWRLRKLILTLYGLQVTNFDASFEPGHGGLGMLVKRATDSRRRLLNSRVVYQPNLFERPERIGAAHLMYFTSLVSRMKIVSGNGAMDIVRFGFVGF